VRLDTKIGPIAHATTATTTATVGAARCRCNAPVLADITQRSEQLPVPRCEPDYERLSAGRRSMRNVRMPSSSDAWASPIIAKSWKSELA